MIKLIVKIRSSIKHVHLFSMFGQQWPPQKGVNTRQRKLNSSTIFSELWSLSEWCATTFWNVN